MMTDSYIMRPAQAGDEEAMLALLPQLADFNIPPARKPEELWQDDARLLKRILDPSDATAPDSFADVVTHAQDDTRILGLIIVTLRGELLSAKPSAHLEAIVVDPAARGQGLGAKLLEHAQHRAADAGAQSLSLHVFARNERAHALYRKHGFDSELIRAIKWFED